MTSNQNQSLPSSVKNTPYPWDEYHNALSAPITGSQNVSVPFKLTLYPKKGFWMLLAYISLAPLCNSMYALLRAQNSKNRIAKTVTFILGFPFTLLTYFAVTEGSEEICGIYTPTKKFS